ncbi:MAG: VWA domain-containing protein [Planctomycetota bacterium]
MAFLHLWPLVLGGLALGLPVLIHWLTRPRPLRLPLSTIRFVELAVHQRRARHRLRDALILALRALAVALLAVAFARPLLGERPLVAPGETAAALRVVVLDTSQSMAARDHGIARFERARATAAEYLAYRSGLRANLVLAAATARPVFEKPSNNFAALRAELADAAVTPQRLDLAAAVSAAAGLLAGGDPQTRRELIIISDFQRTNWAAADLSPLPEDTLIQLESVVPPEAPGENVAILRAGAAGRLERGKEARLEVEVGNFSGAARRVEVDVSLPDASFRLGGVCPAGATTVLTTDTALPHAGWPAGEARLVGVEDALAQDDVRPFVLNVRPALVAALVTREPVEQKPSSSFFLERALAPRQTPAAAPTETTGDHAGGGGQTRVVRLAPTQLDPEALATADLLVLDHPGLLTAEQVRLVSALVQRGRPLLYVAAEPVDATNLRLLADAAGTALQMPVEFQPPAANQPRRGLFWSDLRREAAPFASLGEELAGQVGGLRFAGGLTSRLVGSGLADDVLVAYNDRSAALVVSACGAGAVAVLNADLGYSSLPRSPLFVPLLGELTERLLGQRQIVRSAACGEALVAYLPAEAGAATGLRVRLLNAAGAAQDRGELIDEPAGVVWRWNAVAAPGVYIVERGAATGAGSPTGDDATVFAVAAATPAEESDLRPLAPDVLKGRLAGGRKVHFQSADSAAQARDDRWVWFAVACIGCLLLEIVALKLYRT